MEMTIKERLVRELRLAQKQLDRPPPERTTREKQSKETARIKNVGLFNQRLEAAKAMGLAVTEAAWPQPFQDTGFGGVVQVLGDWDDVAKRNRDLLMLLEKAEEPAKPVPADDPVAPSQ